jgi:serine/threonine protein kinase
LKFYFICFLELRGTPGYLAPEILRAQMYENAPGYGIEVDMWAAGVLMFTLWVQFCIILFMFLLFCRLAGYGPFYHRKEVCN